MVRNPIKVDGKLTDAPSDCTVSSLALHELPRKAAGAGCAPLQGDDWAHAAAKPDDKTAIPDVPETEGIAQLAGAPAVISVNEEQARTVILPGTALSVGDPIYPASRQCELAVEDSHWQRYFGSQYRKFRNVQFE
jgi:hypothetical protein